jgi:hypothetical protein
LVGRFEQAKGGLVGGAFLRLGILQQVALRDAR